jgi:hypothetical protein
MSRSLWHGSFPGSAPRLVAIALAGLHLAKKGSGRYSKALTTVSATLPTARLVRTGQLTAIARTGGGREPVVRRGEEVPAVWGHPRLPAGYAPAVVEEQSTAGSFLRQAVGEIGTPSSPPTKAPKIVLESIRRHRSKGDVSIRSAAPAFTIFVGYLKCPPKGRINAPSFLKGRSPRVVLGGRFRGTTLTLRQLIDGGRSSACRDVQCPSGRCRRHSSQA